MRSADGAATLREALLLRQDSSAAGIAMAFDDDRAPFDRCREREDREQPPLIAVDGHPFCGS